MSDWQPLTLESAKALQGATVEARRGDGEIEAHEMGVIYWSFGERWLQIGDGQLAWSNGLRLDGLWLVRSVGPTLHKDARAFAEAL